MKNTESNRVIKSALRQLNSVAYRQGQATGIQLVEFGLKLSRRFGLNLARQKAAYALSGYV